MFFKEKRRIIKIILCLLIVSVSLSLCPTISFAVTSATYDSLDKSQKYTRNETKDSSGNTVYTVNDSRGNTYSLSYNDWIKVGQSTLNTGSVGDPPPTTDNSGFGDFIKAIVGCIAAGFSIGISEAAGWTHCTADFFYALTQIASFFVGVVGFLFNEVFNITVIHMTENIEKIKVIEVGWTVIRDMANILFIFMLLYLAISTILQLDEHGVKHGLSRLIIGAMLINFSLFFVKIPIDVSNILAIEIYDKINPTTTSGLMDGEASPGGRVGLGDAVLAMFKPQSVFNDPSLANEAIVGSTSTPDTFKNNPVTTFIMAMIIMFSAMFIFLAVIIIFIKRFITLIMLMIFSPLAFAGMAIPNHNIEHEITHRFWNSLLKESFYAPVFMFMMYLTLQVGKALTSPEITNALIGKTYWESIIQIPISNVISYAVILGMMIFSLTVSEIMGVKGASGAIKAFDGMRTATTSWVGRNTISRVASTFINAKGESSIMGQWGDELRDAAAGKRGGNFVTKTIYTMGARAITSSADKLAKPFDAQAEVNREWMEAAISNRHGDHKLTAELFAQAAAPSALGVFSTMSVDRKAADNQFHHMSLEQKANMKKYLEDMADDKTIDPKTDKNAAGYDAKQRTNANEALKRYYTAHGHGRLEQDEVAQLPRTEAGELTYYDNKFRELVGTYGTAKDSKDKTSALSAVRKFIQDSKSEAQMTSAVRSLGVEVKTFEGGAGKDLREALSDEVRKKFKGGSFYEGIGKDSILGEELRSAVAAGAYEQKITYNLYEALNSNMPEAISRGLAEKFAEKLKKLNDPVKDANIILAISDYKKAILNGTPPDYKALIAAYKQDRAGTDEIVKNLTQQTNGKRVLLKTPEVEKEITDLEKEFTRKDASGKNVYEVKLGN